MALDLLLILVIAVAAVIGFVIGKVLTDHYWQIDKLPKLIEDRLKTSRSVLGGQFAEQLAPYLPDFPFSPTEARFIGKPIDFIVFKGADTKEISEVIFVEVKSGNARVNAHEKNLKTAIEQGKVKWVEYRIPKDITTKK